MIDKNSELVKLMKAWVDQQYDEGRVTVMSRGELEALTDETCERLGISIHKD